MNSGQSSVLNPLPEAQAAPAPDAATRTAARVAVLIPCFNEEMTVAKVIADFRRELPDAAIYVFDNASTDATGRVAREAGATVIPEARQGKGHVVAAMLEKVRAEFYVMVDGDDTYPAERVHDLLAPVVRQEADMTVGARLAEYDERSFRRFHVLGNNLVRWMVNRFFGTRLTDILSGYRAFGREIVRRIPVVSPGFEIETELTIQTLYYGRRIKEVPTPYRGRPTGSVSKLSTFRDGVRVMIMIFHLARTCRPLTFFGGIGLVLFLLGLLAGAAPIYDYLTDPMHYVRRVPLAILACGLMILAAGCVFVGILLNVLNSRFRELHELVVRQSSLREPP